MEGQILLLIAPATANTLGKIMAGIDDTPVTTFATTAIGAGKPVMIVPAMHEDMYNHPAVMENIEKVKGWGINFIGPRIEEGIAKIAVNDVRLFWKEREIGNKTYVEKILITKVVQQQSPLTPYVYLQTGHQENRK
ncbi:MAG: flavoprotein [Methanolobus sp.]